VCVCVCVNAICNLMTHTKEWRRMSGVRVGGRGGDSDYCTEEEKRRRKTRRRRQGRRRRNTFIQSKALK
jgi:hypothetical protein